MLILSVLGFLLSVLAHLLSVLEFELTQHWFLLHLGVFVVWLPAVVGLKKYFEGRHVSWEAAFGTCPTWMWLVLSALSLISH